MQHHKKSNRVEGAVPCGNPKRYGSRDVVHMLRDKKRKNKIDDDGATTECEKHLHTLLNHQIKTDVTIDEQFSQHRSFSLATSHDPGVEKLVGVHNFEKFKTVTDLDARVDYLRHCGLDDEEITLKLLEEMKDKVDVPTVGYGADPQSKLQKLREIERKIQEKKKLLKVPDTFKGALELSRQTLELEKSQGLRQDKESSLTGIITIQKKFEITHPDDPVNHIHEMISNIEGKKEEREPRRERRRRRKLARKQLYYAAFESDGDGCSEDADCVIFSSVDQERDDLNKNCINADTIASSEISNWGQPVPTTRTAEVARRSTSCDTKLQNTLSSEGDSRRPKTCIVTESSKPIIRINTPVQFISEDEIMKNRLSVDEIRATSKFQNYSEGEPNKVVYVKNLHIKTTEEDLVALFGSLQDEGKAKIVFKILSGRMKGQAFITFPDEITASKAVKLVNGYKFQDKPMILSFGKKQNT